MTFRLVESYDDDFVVEIAGRTFPATCLVEDDDAIRLLVTPSQNISGHVWTRAHAAGAAAILWFGEMPGAGDWKFMFAERFIDRREEHAPSGEFRTKTSDWFDIIDGLEYRDLQESGGISQVKTGFVHLHAHSEYSALDGLSKVTEMVDAVVADSQPAMAVTDHGVCAAHPALQKAADKAGIKPIFGIEANFVDDRFLRGDPDVKDSGRKILGDYRHLVLWAMNDEGLHNLWAISTEANRDGFYGRPRMDWDTLTKFNAGVMCSTACLKGPLATALLADDEELMQQRLSRLMNIFDDRLYIELGTNKLAEQKLINQILIEVARVYSLPTIAVVDSHYPTIEDHQTHKVWIAAQLQKGLSDDQELFAGDSDYHMMRADEVRKALDYLPAEAIEAAMANTVAVADRCEAKVSKLTSHAPIFSKKGGVERDRDRLIDLCMSNWDRKITKRNPSQPIDVYVERFEREMRLLSDKEFCGYFLMVAGYCHWAKTHSILVGPGRGSGGGSLVAYLADITELDPVEANLMFERFLTEGRTALPDFDVDFPSSKRDAIHEYIRDQYGEDSVVRVGTVQRFKNKAIVRTLARVLGKEIEIFYPDIEAVSKIIDEAEADSAGLGMPWDDMWDQHEEVLGPYRIKYPMLFDYADKTVGRVNTYGKHAAGIVISTEGVLIDRLPMRNADGQMVAEFDMNQLEELGLVKFDFLFLRTLDTIQMAIDLVRHQRGEEINIYDWTDEYTDERVWEEVAAGNTLGIFQIETRAGTRLTKRFAPMNMHELADVITLVRPGPTRSGLTETYFRRKAGDEPVSFPDPRLATVLSQTYGCLLYQEDILATCMTLGGYTSNEADEVRKILGKKQVEKAQEAGRVFVARCVEHGMGEPAATALWNQMAEFAKYSFNRAHAYGYAVLGYWTAWLKFLYTPQFITAVLSSVDKDRIPDFIQEARRMGFKVLPPDINRSGEGFTGDDEVVRYGLDSVKGIGSAAVRAIVQGQPYKSYEDFLERKGKAANIGVIKTLVAVGAFDSLIQNRRALEAKLDWETDQASIDCVFKDVTFLGPNGLPCHFDWDNEPVEIGKSGRPKKQKSLPKKCSRACRNYTAPTFDDNVDPYTEADIRDREKELLGVYLSSSPFDFVHSDPELEKECRNSEEIEAGDAGEYIVAAIISKVKPHHDRNGKEMGFLGLTTETGDLDVTVFKDAWRRYKNVLRQGALCFAMLYRQEDGRLQLNHLQPL